MTGLMNNVLVGVGVTWVAATFSLVGRVVVRWRTALTWWYEDYFCVSAFIFACCYNGLLYNWTLNSYLGHIMEDSLSNAMRDEIIRDSKKHAFFASLSYATSIASSKLTILALYWRIFKTSSIRIPIQVMFGLSILWLVVRTFMTIFRCWPVQAYWDEHMEGGSCNIEDSHFFFGTVLTHFFMDVVILVLPILEVFKLRLKLGQKLAITAVFVLGAAVCIASVFVLIYSINSDPDTDQLPYDYALNYTWGSVELNLAIVSACVPLLRPLFRQLLGPKAMGSYPTDESFANSEATRVGSIRSTPSRQEKDKQTDPNGSMERLSDEEQGMSSDTSDTASRSSVRTPEPVKTTIKGPNDRPSSWKRIRRGPGIHVQNEVVVSVNKAKSGQPTTP